MDLQSITDIIAGIAGLTGGGLDVKALQNHNKLKEKIKVLDQQITINQTHFTELKMYIMSIETKIDVLCMTINNSNNNEIIFNKSQIKEKSENEINSIR